MKKVLIVSDDANHQCKNRLRIVDAFIGSFLQNHYDVTLLSGDGYGGSYDTKVKVVNTHHFQLFHKSQDPRRYFEVLDVADTEQPDLIFFIETPDIQNLYLVLNMDERGKQYKLAMQPSLGLGQLKFYKINAFYFTKLEAMSNYLYSLFISNNCQYDLSNNNLSKREKSLFLADLAHGQEGEETNYNKINKISIREQLNLPKNKTIYLYFGNYYYLKGTDILAEAIQELKNNSDYFFLLVGDMNSAAIKIELDGLANVCIVNRYISDNEMYEYFAASDFLIAPYRKKYSRITSGVFAQSCVSKTPLLTSDITPFKQTIESYDLGRCFEAESCSSLVKNIQAIATQKFNDKAFNHYMKEQQSFTSLSYIIKTLTNKL